MQKDAGVEQASVTATRAGSVGTAEGTLWPGDRGWCSAALRCSGAAARKLAVEPSALPAR